MSKSNCYFCGRSLGPTKTIHWQSRKEFCNITHLLELRETVNCTYCLDTLKVFRNGVETECKCVKEKGNAGTVKEER